MPEWIRIHVISEEPAPPTEQPTIDKEAPPEENGASADVLERPSAEIVACPFGKLRASSEPRRREDMHLEVADAPVVVSTRHVVLATMVGVLMLMLAGAIWFYRPARDIPPTSTGSIARRLASDKPVAIVNGEPITEAQLERDVGIGRVLYPLLRGIPVSDDPETLERMRADLLSSLIDERLLVQAAEKVGLTIEDALLEARWENILSRVGLTEADLAEMLASVGVTMSDVRASLRSTMLAEKFVAENPPPAGVSGKSAYERWARALQQQATIEIVMEEAKGRTVKLNQPAPDFTLRTPDGDAISLSDFAGQPVLINFWATWCPPCRYEMPFLQAAYDKYKDQGFVVLAVDIQETPEVVKPFLQEYGLTFPVVLDRSGAVSSAYRVQAIPTSVFVDRQGVVVDIHRGALTPEQLQIYLDKIVQVDK